MSDQTTRHQLGMFQFRRPVVVNDISLNCHGQNTSLLPFSVDALEDTYMRVTRNPILPSGYLHLPGMYSNSLSDMTQRSVGMRLKPERSFHTWSYREDELRTVMSTSLRQCDKPTGLSEYAIIYKRAPCQRHVTPHTRNVTSHDQPHTANKFPAGRQYLCFMWCRKPRWKAGCFGQAR
jgi:hypothetical protein